MKRLAAGLGTFILFLCAWLSREHGWRLQDLALNVLAEALGVGFTIWVVDRLLRREREITQRQVQSRVMWRMHHDGAEAALRLAELLHYEARPARHEVSFARDAAARCANSIRQQLSILNTILAPEIVATAYEVERYIDDCLGVQEEEWFAQTDNFAEEVYALLNKAESLVGQSPEDPVGTLHLRKMMRFHAESMEKRYAHLNLAKRSDPTPG